MKLTKTVFIVLLLETLIVFGLCVGAGFIFSEEPEWALINPMLYKFQTGLLYFFNLLPAIFITGIMVGYSWGFGKKKVNPTHRFSAVALPQSCMSSKGRNPLSRHTARQTQWR